MKMNKSNRSIFGLLLSGAVALTSCGKITVQVKKDAKNSTLQSSENSAQATQETTSLADSDDFLKQLDGLRTTAASIIVKQLASQDYVGKFRQGVRKYRTFLKAKASTDKTLTDSFYTDNSLQCRERGLNINIDQDNEVLGMLLQTALLAKISEANVGKLNEGLTTELKALSQFITMELGVEINGTSDAEKEGEYDIAAGDVSIKLLPLSGESIDDATKLQDANSTLKLNFERRVAKDRIGTFKANISLSDGSTSPATASFDISRSRENDKYVHMASVKMGLESQDPSYSRQIIVTDIPGKKMSYELTDILNTGKDSEATFKTIIDLEKKTQCKISTVIELIGFITTVMLKIIGAYDSPCRKLMRNEHE